MVDSAVYGYGVLGSMLTENDLTINLSVNSKAVCSQI